MHLPNALPDETLFSRIVRYLSLSGTLKEQCLKDLVGNRRAVIHPYLTADLTAISAFTSESAVELCCKQTLRPWFAHYLPRYQQTICDCSIKTNELIRACQLSTFRETEPLAVKFCPLCCIDDIENIGVAYWHCLHQIPGVDVCAKHGVWLSYYALNDREHLSENSLPTPNRYQDKCEPLAIEFAQFAERKLRFIQMSPLNYPDTMQYKSQLANKGLVTNNGRVKRIELMAALYGLSVQILLPNNPLCITSNQDFRYVESLLNGSYQAHPFKHLLLEFFLTQGYVNEDSQTQYVSAEIRECDVCEIEASCCDLLLQGSSMAQVGRDIGKSRCYVKAIALKHHIPVNLKPYKITDGVKNKVSRMAYKGKHRAAIAKQLGISSGSVEMIISSVVGLVEWRKKCKADSKRRRYQCQLLRYFQEHPQSLRQSAKEQCEAAFFWLYLHNPDWLEEHLPNPLKPQHVDRVDWGERDKELAKHVVQILDKADYAMSRTQLDRELGSHGWLTAKKENLPLTLQAYYQWINSRK
ncbi:TPA: TnsD family Tn7-like transposition protein [Vibrio parahaemolyticus]|uniref:TnsD family Tn7-like transposition protein n=1 Tax=Vibrio parahaemolyticus TaxID=670 RepID=UPI001A8D492C|nr:TnsD family Tn7-like transposition protein [Vibrio parahaemolyticus]MBO0156021.1 TniQ family protein [Vibrio parahaemolyticus]MBO0171596.1 TniQ family protein [Vibrio parahaemolyticus]MCX8857409.1 TnsD family transposase [Vibrio parahaemolyticus]MCX8861216.1 TnsD family transposase [Vibrio parahaemolyticus]MCX8867954.1 TnsD family transposase [Vibrio parahaemolyticus]